MPGLATTAVEAAVLRCSTIAALKLPTNALARSSVVVPDATDVSIARIQTQGTSAGACGVKLMMLMKRGPLEASAEVHKALSRAQQRAASSADARQSQARRHKTLSALKTLLAWMADEADRAARRPELSVAVVATTFATQDPGVLDGMLTAAAAARIELTFIAIPEAGDDVGDAALLAFMEVVNRNRPARLTVLEPDHVSITCEMMRLFERGMAALSTQPARLQLPRTADADAVTLDLCLRPLFQPLNTELEAVPLCPCHSEPVASYADIMQNYHGKQQQCWCSKSQVQLVARDCEPGNVFHLPGLQQGLNLRLASTQPPPQATHLPESVRLARNASAPVFTAVLHMKASAFNMAMVCGQLFLVTPSRAGVDRSAASVADLAAALRAAGEVLICRGLWSVQAARASWLPLHYALLPQSSGACLIMARLAGPEDMVGAMGKDDEDAEKSVNDSVQRRLQALPMAETHEHLLQATYTSVVDSYQAMLALARSA